MTLFAIIKLTFTFINTFKLIGSNEDINIDEMKKRLEWSECFILNEEHPWKGLKVQKRKHLFLYNNQSAALLKDRDYQLRLCECFQPIDHFIFNSQTTKNSLLIEFNRIIILEKLEMTSKDWSEKNTTFIKLEVFIIFGDTQHKIKFRKRTITSLNDVVKYRMENRPYLKKIRLSVNNLEFETDISVKFFGCSLICGGEKNSVTDIVYFVQMQMDFPAICLWYIKPKRATSMVLNIIQMDIDCDTSEIAIADGSKPFFEGTFSRVTSLCKNTATVTENLLYSKIWLYYRSGTSSKKPIEHFSVIYNGGCDREYLITESEGFINISITGTTEIQRMKFDCSVYIRRIDGKPFLISFEKLYLFSFTKSSCTSSYVMIYSGNSKINNVPFCESLTPPKYVDARYGWLRLKIINSVPIYDLNIIVKHRLLTDIFQDNSTGTTSASSNDTYEEIASLITFWSLIGLVGASLLGAICFDIFEKIVLRLKRAIVMLVKGRKIPIPEEIRLKSSDTT